MIRFADYFLFVELLSVKSDFTKDFLVCMFTFRFVLLVQTVQKN